MIDALYRVTEMLENEDSLRQEVEQNLIDAGYDTNRMEQNKRMVLVTGHRRENFGDGMIRICNAIKQLSEKYPNVDFVYPVHLNPNVQKPVKEVLGNHLNNVFLIEPLSYLPFVYMMEKSFLILTDSGGVQEEAPSLGKPVLVMRDTTERPEAVSAGTVTLIGTDQQKIVQGVENLLNNAEDYEKMAHAQNPYGDGKACERIVKHFR